VFIQRSVCGDPVDKYSMKSVPSASITLSQLHDNNNVHRFVMGCGSVHTSTILQLCNQVGQMGFRGQT